MAQPNKTAVPPGAKTQPKQGAVVQSEKKTTAVATTADNDVPEYIKQGKQRGSENVEMQDVVIPRIELVQMLSPCLDPKKPEYIEGAAAGMLYNSLTRELYGEEVLVIPALFKKQWLVWKDRLKGGGFRGAFDSPELAHARIDEEPAKEQEMFQAIETAQQLVLVVKDDGSTEEAVVSMARTKLKISKQWNSLIRLNGNDRFSRQYKLFGADDKNEKGEYKNFGIMNAGWPAQENYAKAEALYEAVASGARNVQFDTSESVESEGGKSSEF